MPHHEPVDEEQTSRARELRHEATFPERLLWGRLRNRRLANIKFRRQLPLGPFVVDFYCDDARIAIELDGNSHADRATYDAARTAFLESERIRVIRIGNDDVLTNLDGVLQMLIRECGKT
jgi:very-short-patch-repair endonuclease